MRWNKKKELNVEEMKKEPTMMMGGASEWRWRK
jgi:hypothetical protein